MKKIAVLLLTVFLAGLLCTACVTKKSNNNNLDQERNAAIDATRRMDNSLNN
jgi:outer membrane PBP1 activator LpoA protein